VAPPLPRAPRSAPAVRHAPSTPAAPAPGCDPPYTVDDNGYRKYKRECAN
jgi:hypothetical protein